MKEQASLKTQKFKIEIRRRQRESMMKKQRDFMLANQKLQRKQQTNKGQLSQMVIEKLMDNNIKGLYEAFNKHQNYIDELSQNMISNVLNFITSEESIQTEQGICLLSLFVYYCGFDKMNQTKRKEILKNFKEMHIEEIIFKQIEKNIQQKKEVRVKLLAFCLKYFAFLRFEPIRRKPLLQKYLTPLIQKYISETSVLIFVTYVSEIYPFQPDIVRMVCSASKSKELLAKMSVSTFLNNYITLENDQNNIVTLFDEIMRTLQFLTLGDENKDKNHQAMISNNLQIMIKLIGKYPEMREIQLLTKISRCQIQQLATVMFNVSEQQIKELVYELEEAIIDKTIHGLRQEFFRRFSMEIIYQIFQGIEYTNTAIVARCLKMAMKIVQYAPREIIIKIRSELFTSDVLEDMCYHKNDFIRTLAQNLKIYFPTSQQNDKQQQMNDE